MYTYGYNKGQRVTCPLLPGSTDAFNIQYVEMVFRRIMFDQPLCVIYTNHKQSMQSCVVYNICICKVRYNTGNVYVHVNTLTNLWKFQHNKCLCFWEFNEKLFACFLSSYVLHGVAVRQLFVFSKMKALQTKQFLNWMIDTCTNLIPSSFTLDAVPFRCIFHVEIINIWSYHAYSLFSR